MKCTSCGLKLDMRKKTQYVYSSYQLQSKGFIGNVFGSKDYWVFCSSRCKRNADQDWMSGHFEEKHGNKKINFVP
jgi:hypothetical protein